MQNSENRIWKSQIALSTKHNSFILPTVLYGSECWALSKADVRNIRLMLWTNGVLALMIFNIPSCYREVRQMTHLSYPEKAPDSVWTLGKDG